MSIDKEMAVYLEELQTRVLMGELTNLEDVVFLLQEVEHLQGLVETLTKELSDHGAGK